MAQTLKILGQVRPTAATLTTLYTAPSTVTGGVAIASVIVTNTNVFASTFRISAAVAGAADNINQYLYYDLPIAASDTFIATIGLTLAAVDTLRCQSASGQLNFTVSGVENS